jgi:hypothetical protein
MRILINPCGGGVVTPVNYSMDTADRIEDFMREPSYAESCRIFHERAQAERRQEWIAYHSNLAELHAGLSRDHEQKARQLLEDPPSSEGE